MRLATLFGDPAHCPDCAAAGRALNAVDNKITMAYADEQSAAVGRPTENVFEILFGVAAGAGASKVMPASSAMNRLLLSKDLATQEQMGEIAAGDFDRIAGSGTSTPLRDAPRLAAEYGGEANDWAKVGSDSASFVDEMGFTPMSNVEIERVLSVANSLIAGQIEVIMGCHLLASALRKAKLERHPEALVIVGVDSESEDLPVGPVREQWDPTALAEKDKERERYSAMVHDRVIRACRELVRIAIEELAKEPNPCGRLHRRR